MKISALAPSLKRNISRNRYVWAGILFAVGNWFAESMLHVWVFDQGTFASQVFTDDTHEIWMRLVAGAMFIFFGVSIQGAFKFRQRAELRLKLAHEELNQIFQTASTGMRLIDKDFNVLKVNETFVELSGVPREESVGSKCYEIFTGDRCRTDQCPMKRILESRQEIEYEIRDRTKIDGAEFSCLLTARPFSDHDGRTIGIVESFKDITELTNAQNALRTERDKLEHILFQQFEGVSILRDDYIIEYQNATLTKDIGDCTGTPCYKAFKGASVPCELCYMDRAIETGELQRCEFDLPDGRTFEHTYTPFRDTDSLTKAVVYLRDVTHVKESRAAAIRSEQLAGVGELAAGVAHEINNPINGIINYAQMVINGKGVRQETRELGRRIVGEGNRVARIVASLLSFARRGSEIKVPTSVGEILGESLTLVGTQIRRDAIAVKVNVPKDLPPVLCVPQEIQQVFVNVMNNARYALNQRYSDGDDSKKLEIDACAHEENGDSRVKICFRDYGDGIPADIVDKILNPFFSTKPKGKGTGLGLSISHDIVRSHGGELDILSQPGQYTTICIELPVAQA